jgi:fatty acid hydroxylase domain-containing protein 2
MLAALFASFSETLALRWAQFVEAHSEFELLALYPFLLVVGLYWLHGGAYLLTLDLFRWPGFLYRRYKLQPNPHFDARDLLHLVPNLLFSQMCILLPASLLIYRLSVNDAIPLGFTLSAELPSPLEVVTHLLISLLCVEVGFFYTHWLFHYPVLYAPIHKRHHYFKAPIALAAAYAHPLEVLVNNVFPLLIGPVLLRTHVLCAYLYYALAVLATQHHHSGYRLPGCHLPFDIQPDFHDLHHERFNGNFGLTGLLDLLHGTMLRAKHTPGKKQKKVGVPTVKKSQ